MGAQTIITMGKSFTMGFYWERGRICDLGIVLFLEAVF